GGMEAVGDQRPLGGAAHGGAGDAAERGHRRGSRSNTYQPAARERRRTPHRDGHWASAVESWRRMSRFSDSDSTVTRRLCDSRDDLAHFIVILRNCQPSRFLRQASITPSWARAWLTTTPCRPNPSA